MPPATDGGWGRREIVKEGWGGQGIFYVWNILGNLLVVLVWGSW